MKFTLRVESPLHVGSGEVLGFLDWQLDGRTIAVLDWNRLLAAAQETHEDAVESFAQWSDRIAAAVDSAADEKDAFVRAEASRRARDESAAWRFAKQELKDDALADRVRAGEFDRYRASFAGGRLDRRLEIVAHAKDAAGRPTIPASTLRGHLRSALLHAAIASGGPAESTATLKGAPGVTGWERALIEATPGRARFEFGEALETAHLRPAGHADDARFDAMRFVRVSEPLRSRAELVVVRASPFQMSRQKIAPLQPSMLEAIDVGGEFEFEIRFDAALLKGVAGVDGGTHAFVGGEFWATCSRVFGLTRDDVRSLDAAVVEERALAAIEVALASRTSAFLAREEQWFDRAQAPKDAPLRVFVKTLESAAGERLPLRLGRGGGLHAVTALLALESHATLGEPFARALARVGLGMKPRERRERAEREKHLIEQARQQSGRGGAARLRPELQSEARDPHKVPVARAFTMQGGLPDLFLGCASFARGELSATPMDVEQSAAARTRKLREPVREPMHEASAESEGPRRGDGPPRGRRPDRSGPGGPGRGDRGDRRDRDDGPRRDRRPDRRDREPKKLEPEMPSKGLLPPERREAPKTKLPDRPATSDEINDLLKRFGPRR